MSAADRPLPSASPSERELVDALLSLGLAEDLDAPALDDAALRVRLARRLARSVRDHAHLRTVRRPTEADAQAGLPRQMLHRASASARRPGEPEWIEWMHLPAGDSVTWRPALDKAVSGRPGLHLELLVLHGALQLEGLTLQAEDFLRQPWRTEGLTLSALTETRVYLRLGVAAEGLEEPRCVSRADAAAWEGDPATIERRLLWQQGSQAAVLIRARAGAQAPAHGHRLDEECFMVRGELFTGDVLLCEGDFQLAPAGGPHGVIAARSDVLLYLRGDAEMAVDLADDAPG